VGSSVISTFRQPVRRAPLMASHLWRPAATATTVEMALSSSHSMAIVRRSRLSSATRPSARKKAAADIADRAADYEAGAVGRFQVTVTHQRCLLTQRADAEKGEFAAGGRLESRADRALAREQLADLRRTDDQWSVQVMSVGARIEPGQESQYLLCLNAWRRVAGPAVELRQLQARHSAGTQRTHHAQQGPAPGCGDSHAVEEHAIDVVGCRRRESLASIRCVRHNHPRQAKMIGKFSTQVHVQGVEERQYEAGSGRCLELSSDSEISLKH